MPKASTISFFVGSTNKTKIDAIRLATKHIFPEALITGFEVHSGVSSQPRTVRETREGAENRAKGALAEGLKISQTRENLGIGLEGGVFEENGQLWNTVWVAVTQEDGQIFVAEGARMPLPPILAQPIQAGQEMGPVLAELTKIDDVRSKQGMIGVITNNFVTRTEEYGSIARLAIGLWYGQDWEMELAKH